MTPTSEQQKFLDLAESNTHLSIILTGEAGSGKTWILAQLAKSNQVIFITPTHQARKVLEKELTASGVVAPVTITVASYLKKMLDADNIPDDVFAMEFVKSSMPPPRQGAGTLLVLDEGSMVSVDDMVDIRDTNPDGLTIISIDPKQLPPVGFASAYPALMEAVEEGRAYWINLTRNLRSESPDLTSFINAVRSLGEVPDEIPKEVTTYTDKDEFIASFLRTIHERGDESTFLLAYANATVSAYTNRIRGLLGHPEKLPAIGELLRIDEPNKPLNYHKCMEALYYSPISIASKRAAAKEMADLSFDNGDLVRVVGYEPERLLEVPWADVTIRHTPVLVVALTGVFEGQTLSINQFDSSISKLPTSDVRHLLEQCRDVARAVGNDNPNNLSKGQVKAIQNELPQKKEITPIRRFANGRFFWGVRNKICLVSSPLTSTTHKAQGSGRDLPFVDASDFRGKDKAELLYTAVSRARKEVHILVPKKKPQPVKAEAQ